MFEFTSAENSLKDKVILITGASDGIGKQAALSYAKHGAQLILLARSQDKLEQVHDDIENNGGPAPIIVPIDLEKATPANFDEIAKIINEDFGRLDGLLNNASILGTVCPFDQIDAQEWHQVMQINLNSAFMLTQSMWPLLRASKSASIIFTSSGVGRVGRAFWGISNRGTPDAVAFNGVTMAVMWSQMRELYFQTDACLDDASAPVCPDVAISSDDQAVHLAWTPVDDPESGIWRYNVYRDGFMLAEQFSSSSTLDDEGFHPAQVNSYEVRALNGAYLESTSCPVLTWSPVSGDSNGDGVLSVLDLFYLINYFYGGGPAPLGDADANGDGSFTPADIFYLINYFYSGGPPPLVPAHRGFEMTQDGPAKAVSAAPTFAIESADELRMPVMSALPQALIEVPVYLRDLSGTILGMDQPAGQHIQGLSLSVVYSPAAAVESIAFARAGLTEGLTPLFETTVHSGNQISWIASFDETVSPLVFDLDGAEPGDLVAKLVIRIDEAAIEESILNLSFDADTTIVSNQAGTLGESAANGLLSLGASAIEVIDCSTDGDVVLPNQTIDFPLVCEAGGSITAGPGLTVLNPADVLLRAGFRVVLAEEFSTEAHFVAEIDPSLVP